jgi:hypothetical protein
VTHKNKCSKYGKATPKTFLFGDFFQKFTLKKEKAFIGIMAPKKKIAFRQNFAPKKRMVPTS